MADMDKDRLKELEIESILEETHYLADQERMEQTAQKYRAKPKIEEIFSNADKKPRLKSPTKYTVYPRCINLFENPLAANPERPAPPTKILFASVISFSTDSKPSLSICFAFPFNSSRIAKIFFASDIP